MTSRHDKVVRFRFINENDAEASEHELFAAMKDEYMKITLELSDGSTWTVHSMFDESDS